MHFYNLELYYRLLINTKNPAFHNKTILTQCNMYRNVDLQLFPNQMEVLKFQNKIESIQSLEHYISQQKIVSKLLQLQILPE